MRANSIGEMAKDLEMSVEDIASRKLYSEDVERFRKHTGAIIWADRDKEDFCIMLEDTDQTIYNFVWDIRR